MPPRRPQNTPDDDPPPRELVVSESTGAGQIVKVYLPEPRRRRAAAAGPRVSSADVRALVERKVEAMDEIELLIDLPGNVAKSLLKKLETKLRDTFSLRIPVRIVKSGSLPRHEFKAKRWRRL